MVCVSFRIVFWPPRGCIVELAAVGGIGMTGVELRGGNEIGA